ncbi:MAG TPA: cyclodeaminase/cyclohydrolase family protein [Anaerolineae bacterium]|nr:cyclodeaminase/cyclohydrolase family protein [Anaerolineae bacterium]HQJ50779.1 cyclodeaminase/cyclohydrolase family protein [Anaerolineae bacterium]
MLIDKPLNAFLDELASSAPAPGGGSAAALAGAVGAALVSMVANLTLGKKDYVNVQDDIQRLLKESEALRCKCQELLDADVAAYSHVSQVSKMPRDTDEQKATRSAAMQAALKNATAVPMELAQVCVDVLRLCPEATAKGNVRAVSDVGVAALMAEAGLRAAALNVLINLGSIKDEVFVGQERLKLMALLSGKPELKERVLKEVETKL